MKAQLIMIISSILFLGCTEADKLERMAVDAFEKGLIDSSLQYINSAIELDNKDASKYFHRSEIYNSSKNYSNALNDVNTAIELRDSRAKYYFLKGNILLNMSQYEKALDSYDSALKLRANSKGFNGRGKVYEALGDTVLAIKDYEKAVATDSCYFLTYASLSSIYRETNKLDESIYSAKKGLNMYLNCKYKKRMNLEEMFFLELAHTYILQNDYENACSYLAKIDFHYKELNRKLKYLYCSNYV